MTTCIGRREFITLAGGALAFSWPLAARAQQGGPMRRVAIFEGGIDPVWQSYAADFREGLAKLGWIEGRNLRIDLRFAPAEPDRIQAIAAELVSLAPDVIFVSSGVATRMVQQQTQTIPIVFAGASISDDTVKNIARPEGNTTGFHILYPSIGGKWLELIKEATPHLAHAAVIYGASSGRGADNYFGAIEAAARVLGIRATKTPFQDDDDLGRTIDVITTDRNGGLIILPGTSTGSRENRQSLLLLAARYRLPVIHWDRNYPAEGGLMSYGSDPRDQQRRAVAYVDRILRGAKIIELPVQFPTRFELIINLKAAKAIGLSIPETFLVRADEVIE